MDPAFGVEKRSEFPALNRIHDWSDLVQCIRSSARKHPCHPVRPFFTSPRSEQKEERGCWRFLELELPLAFGAKGRHDKHIKCNQITALTNGQQLRSRPVFFHFCPETVSSGVTDLQPNMKLHCIVSRFLTCPDFSDSLISNLSWLYSISSYNASTLWSGRLKGHRASWAVQVSHFSFHLYFFSNTYNVGLRKTGHIYVVQF